MKPILLIQAETIPNGTEKTYEYEKTKGIGKKGEKGSA